MIRPTVTDVLRDQVSILKDDRIALSRALSDAISTYGPKEEILVTEERIETWKAVLAKHGVSDWGFKVGEEYPK